MSKFTDLRELLIPNDNQESNITGKSLEKLSTLTSHKVLNLDSNDIPASELFRLHRLKNLETLTLRYTPIGKSGLETLNRLPKLKILTLRKKEARAGTRLADDNLPQQACLWNYPFLTSLDLSGNQVTDEGLRFLSGFENITSLDIG